MTDRIDTPPEPVLHAPGRLRFSLIWLVPLVAALIGLTLAVRTWLETGPTITIVFATAEGLETGQTRVRYKDVIVGTVTGINLSDDDKQVRVDVELTPTAARLAVDDTNFWVVRPRIGIGGITGIGTLISGAYIGLDVGRSSESRREFIGLEKPPAITYDRLGRRYTLHTADAGSIALGAPVYYRRVVVGQVVDAKLDDDGRRVTVNVFIEAPYDRFVTANTRFWNASGVDLALSAEGLRVNTQSLASVVAGGIAFQPLDEAEPGEPAAENADFELYADTATALAPLDGPSTTALLVFQQTTRGLTVGSPVDFQGITIGDVRAIKPEYDTTRKSFYTNVLINLYLERLGPAYETLSTLDDAAEPAPHARVLQRFIDQGLHAQLRPGNLLTGQLYVALLFKAAHTKTRIVRPGAAIEIPTTPGTLEEIQTQIESIVTKIDAIPFAEMAGNLNSTLKNANALLTTVDQELAPEARKVLAEASTAIKTLEQNLGSPDSALQQDTRRMLEQINRTAASLRALTDYLERHPEALLRGRPNDPSLDRANDQPPDEVNDQPNAVLDAAEDTRAASPAPPTGAPADAPAASENRP